MREDFVRVFGGIEAIDRDSQQLAWLVRLIDTVADRALKPRGMKIRSDAFVFLFHNLRLMVVIPWQLVHGADFNNAEMTEVVEEDLEKIIEVAANLSEASDKREVSANALFQAIAQLDSTLQVRAEDFWGP